ncbi:DMT family transporter [Methylibium sp.]|uniref:DMT family transporter n=1 Tax=Methylibium sp. TaxID=2067992 RepID=UPI00286B2CE3|nr:DMT family transporter [Methylibium sp.]
MKAQHLIELLMLAALWGASFLFMRLGAAEFGPVALSALRVGIATLALLPLLLWRGQLALLRAHWRAIAVVGVVNSALPFVLFSTAALAINAGLSSIFNATAPLWGALIAWAWLGERLTLTRVAGLALGFAGVLWLAWDTASVKPGEHGVSAALAIAACLAATLCYGFGANYTKRRLSGVAPLAVATGSQLAATVVLLLPALWLWPAVMPSTTAWGSVAGLALLCTAVAYLLYFHLIDQLGAARAITVTFLLPVFGLLWGAIFLAEKLTPAMLFGCAVILLGTALTTGVLRWPVRQPA